MQYDVILCSHAVAALAAAAVLIAPRVLWQDILERYGTDPP